MRERKCNSCHNVTFLVWTHNEAAARGFDVDRTKLAEWTKWSLADSLSDRFWFKLRPRAMASLKADGLPEALLAKLKPLEGKTYLTRQEYLHARGGGRRAAKTSTRTKTACSRRPLFRTTAAGRTLSANSCWGGPASE